MGYNGKENVGDSGSCRGDPRQAPGNGSREPLRPDGKETRSDGGPAEAGQGHPGIRTGEGRAASAAAWGKAGEDSEGSRGRAPRRGGRSGPSGQPERNARRAGRVPGPGQEPNLRIADSRAAGIGQETPPMGGGAARPSPLEGTS